MSERVREGRGEGSTPVSSSQELDDAWHAWCIVFTELQGDLVKLTKID